MITLQQAYKMHTSKLKKFLSKNEIYDKDEHNQQDSLVSASSYDNVPTAVQVFSGEDESVKNDSFMILNRERVHLKESTIAYLKEQHLDPLLKRINLGEWQDYTDQVLLTKPTESKEKKRSLNTPQTGHQVKKMVRNAFFVWPINRAHFWLSSFFGPRKKPNGSWGFHYGIDMAALKGTPVKAASRGIVIESRYAPGYGNTVVIAHDARYKTRYAHLDRIDVKVGNKIAKDELIGTVGSTGFVRTEGKDASHLHFEVYERGKRVNPLRVLA